MKIITEFKEFAVKGNVIDLAVGIIMGGAFGKIVSSLVNDILMPPIGIILGNVNFSELRYILKHAKGDVKEVAINYGQFIQSTIDFLIIAFCVFIMIKAINKLKKKEEEKAVEPAPAPQPTKEELLLTEIRDILKANK